MLLWFLCPFSIAQAQTGFGQFTLTAPSYNQTFCGDTTSVGLVPLTDLKEIRIYRRYFECPSIVKLILTIPAIGKEGQQISFSLPYVGSGNCGEFWPIAVDKSGNESCKGATFVFASQYVP